MVYVVRVIQNVLCVKRQSGHFNNNKNTEITHLGAHTYKVLFNAGHEINIYIYVYLLIKKLYIKVILKCKFKRKNYSIIEVR